MPITDANTLKSWFQSKDKPTQEQFWSLIDSFRHKQDNVPASDVDGLSGLLSNYLLKKEVSEPGVYDPAENYFFGAANQQYVSFANESSANPQFQSEGFYRLVEDAPAGESPETHPAHWAYQGAVWGELAIADVAGLAGALEALSENGGLNLWSGKTIFVSPNGDDSRDNFVATGMRARRLIGDDTAGATIVVLAGEYNWDITEENLPIAEYPNQLAGDGLTWMFQTSSVTISSNNTIFLFGNRNLSATIDYGWIYGTNIYGADSALINSGDTAVFDFDGLGCSLGRSLSKYHIELYKIISENAPVISEYTGEHINSFIGSLTLNVTEMVGDIKMRTCQNIFQRIKINAHQITCPNIFLFDWPSSRNYYEGFSYMDVDISVYKISAPKVNINLGLLQKVKLHFTMIINLAEDLFILAHSNHTDINISWIKGAGVIFGAFPASNFITNSSNKFNANYQTIIVGADHDIVYYQGYDNDATVDLSCSSFYNKSIQILNNAESWTDQQNKRQINLRIPKPVSTLVLENCDVNIDTISTIGKIIAKNTATERNLNIKQPIAVDASNVDKSLIELHGQYKLNVENTLSLGESLSSLETPTYGVELFDEAQIVFNGGSIENRSADENFLLLKNSKETAGTDILVKHRGGGLNDDSIKAEQRLGQFQFEVLSVAETSIDIHINGQINRVGETDTATYSTIALLSSRMSELINALPEAGEISATDYSPNVRIGGNTNCGFFISNPVNCEINDSVYESSPLSISDYLSGGVSHTLSRGYLICDQRKEAGVYDLTVMANRGGGLHISLEYWIFDGTPREIEILPKGNYTAKLFDFVDKQLTAGLDSNGGAATSVNTFSAFRNSGTPLSYSNTCNDAGELCVYRDTDGLGSVQYRNDARYADIDLGNGALIFTIAPTYYTPSAEPYQVKRILTISGFINEKKQDI